MAVDTKHVSDMTKEELTAFLGSFDNVLCDCDGVLYRSGNVIPGAPELLRYLDEKGKRIFYVSNNAAKSRKQYVVSLGKMGYPVLLDHVMHSGFVAADYIKSQNIKKVYVAGPKEVCAELDEVGVAYEHQEKEPMPDRWESGIVNELIASRIDPDVDCVVVGFDVNMSYIKVARAANYLKNKDAKFLATDNDSSFPIAGGHTLPGSGPTVAAVSTTADREPTIVGKPSRLVYDTVVKHFPEVVPERTIIFGDRAESDTLLGRNCGVRSLMVGTGIDTLESATKLGLTPEFWADSLGHVWQRIKADLS